tara:strand:+ start:15847 stop:16863 length:1017 start_codon:yes stop_codon:yes gene_type:complete
MTEYDSRGAANLEIKTEEAYHANETNSEQARAEVLDNKYLQKRGSVKSADVQGDYKTAGLDVHDKLPGPLKKLYILVKNVIDGGPEGRTMEQRKDIESAIAEIDVAASKIEFDVYGPDSDNGGKYSGIQGKIDDSYDFVDELIVAKDVVKTALETALTDKDKYEKQRISEDDKVEYRRLNTDITTCERDIRQYRKHQRSIANDFTHTKSKIENLSAERDKYLSEQARLDEAVAVGERFLNEFSQSETTYKLENNNDNLLSSLQTLMDDHAGTVTPINVYKGKQKANGDVKYVKLPASKPKPKSEPKDDGLKRQATRIDDVFADMDKLNGRSRNLEKFI